MPTPRQPAVDELIFQVKVAGLPAPKTEYQFMRSRKFKADLCWPHEANPLIVEVDGGLYLRTADGKNGGRHSRGKGREQDYERDAEAMKLGYRVLRCSPKQVKSGQAIAWITELLR